VKIPTVHQQEIYFEISPRCISAHFARIRGKPAPRCCNGNVSQSFNILLPLMCFQATLISQKINSNVGFEVITAEAIKISIFWDIMPYSPVKVNRRLLPASCYTFLFDLVSDPENDVPPKRRLTSAALQGVIS
jgi:hypothetical protein